MKKQNVNAALVQRGRGKGRDPWGIRKFLWEKGLTMAAVGRLCGSHPVVAQETVRGIRNDKKVLGYLEQIGCPIELLYGDSK
ncbi:hypothetical protein LJC47_00120 [Desulfosarcina sp. OttesenSCG-928-B08]|nr:hypothetical protein [Desulfosarcina sp. OttesenSCG-928-B08]